MQGAGEKLRVLEVLRSILLGRAVDMTIVADDCMRADGRRFYFVAPSTVKGTRRSR